VDDGCFEYVAVKTVSRPMMLRLLPEFMRGKHLRFPQINLQTFRELEIESKQPLYIHMDGEIFSGFSSNLQYLKVEHHPKALTIVA
jgi:diacylglycerol kinase family enzyme